MNLNDAAGAKARAQAEAKLEAYIDIARNKLNPFGAELPFDAPKWDVTEALGPQQGHLRSVCFTQWNEGHSGTWKLPLEEPVAAFAKAYVLHRWSLRNKGALDAQLRAIRSLHDVFIERGIKSMSLADGDTFAAAARILEARCEHAPAYTAARELEHMAKALTDAQLTVVPVRFNSWLSKQTTDGARIGAQFDARRMSKLPSPAAIRALGAMFGLAEDLGDRVTIDVLAILTASPDRVGEALSLPVDCEVEEEHDGALVYGLRWLNEKGAPPSVKWVSREMEPVIREAVARLRDASKRARHIALWYEVKPTSLYLDPEFEHLRYQEWLTREEASAMIWKGPVARTVLNMMLVQNNIPKELVRNKGQGGSGVIRVRFADLEHFLLKKIPPGFPILNRDYNLKFSDALCVFPADSLHGTKTELRSMITRLTHSQINSRISQEHSVRTQTIFEKFGFQEEDGNPIKFHTHMLRHLLNTMAQDAGLSQFEIALISGRKVVAQNRAYDHVSADRMLQHVRELGDKPFEIATSENTPVLRQPIAINDIGKFNAVAFHMSEIGACTHDFAMTPCMLHRDCINCEEMFCVKGDHARAQRIRTLRDQTRLGLETAEREQGDGTYGASRWVTHQKSTLERLDTLVLLFDDELVPVGALIHVATAKWSLESPRASVANQFPLAL